MCLWTRSTFVEGINLERIMRAPWWGSRRKRTGIVCPWCSTCYLLYMEGCCLCYHFLPLSYLGRYVMYFSFSSGVRKKGCYIPCHLILFFTMCLILYLIMCLLINTNLTEDFCGGPTKKS